MYIIIAGLCGVVLILIVVFLKYQRQVKDICRQLYFLKENESNMLITKEINWGGIGELSSLLNSLLLERKEEKRQYVKKEQMIADTYTNLSHDIRTPLTSLDGYFQLLEESKSEEERIRYLKVIQERIDSLKEMLEELFTYTKLQNESYELASERLNLTQVLKETLFSYYDNWIEYGIEPELAITDKIIWIEGNRQAICRVVQNIIKNGLEHGEKKIGVSLSEEGKEAVLTFVNEVKDPKQIDVEKVFERFYKADAARSKNSSGLGLAIAREFVRKMGGEISARLNNNQFFIVIRLKKADGGI